MFKTILVPIDIAQREAGGLALDLARKLPDGKGRRLILLSVIEQVPNYIMSQMPPDVIEKARASAREMLDELAAEHGLGGKKAETVVREGYAGTEILEYAKESGADLIVIASHDPGFADYLLGSVASRVVRHAHCSVMVARKLAG